MSHFSGNGTLKCAECFIVDAVVGSAMPSSPNLAVKAKILQSLEGGLSVSVGMIFVLIKFSNGCKRGPMLGAVRDRQVHLSTHASLLHMLHVVGSQLSLQVSSILHTIGFYISDCVLIGPQWNTKVGFSFCYYVNLGISEGMLSIGEMLLFHNERSF